MSRCFFHFFKILVFWVVRQGRGGLKGKKWPEMKKNHLIPYLWKCTSYDCGFWYSCKIYPAIFFHFFKILIFWVFQSSSINAKRKFWKRNPSSHVCDFFWFFTFTCYKKSNDASICKIISTVFWLQIILDRLLKNCIKLYFSFSFNM